MAAPMCETQDVSVIMPARNVAATVERSVRSVLAEPEVLELIVVDDASDDDTPQILERLRAEDPRLVVIKGGNLGVTKGVNRGLEEARGAYFARCDADDWWKENRLAWQRPFLEQNPDYVAVTGGFSTVTEKGDFIADMACDGAAGETTADMLNGDLRSHLCAMLVRMEAVRELGGMREWFFSAQDLDMQCRLAELGRVWHDPRPVLSYTLHDASITHTLGSQRRLFYQHAASTFARQRRETGADDLMRGTPPEFVPEDGAEERARSASEHIADQFTGAGWRMIQSGARWSGLVYLFRALRREPMRIARWRNLAAGVVKASFSR